MAGLRPHGRLVVLGADMEPIAVQTGDLIFGGRTVNGILTGTPIDLRFSLTHGIRPTTEARECVMDAVGELSVSPAKWPGTGRPGAPSRPPTSVRRPAAHAGLEAARFRAR
ncbi:hypothetical protein [Streptomyces sp. NPDC001292]|uniref:hypothetical protein n=1 Tax=Streptomyces sp. NPDC001292 TaxID=3364558 RepID=UPI0036B6427E